MRSGREQRLKSDHSITIRGNTWYDHSKCIGGYPIDFVKMFYDLDFQQAMIELVGEGNKPLKRKVYHKQQEKPETFVLPPHSKNMKRAFAYLLETRGIDSAVLSFFAKEKLVYESEEISAHQTKKIHNIIFVGRDENGIAKYAQKRSLYSEDVRFVQTVKASDERYRFDYFGGSNTLYVFEAPIDMLSYITMHKDTNWKEDNYIALCGTSPVPLEETLDRHNNIEHVVICTDNDKTGNHAHGNFQEILSSREIAATRIIPKAKDFNDDLLQQIAEEKQLLQME